MGGSKHPECDHGDPLIHKCAGGELLSIARISAVTKENLREGDSGLKRCSADHAVKDGRSVSELKGFPILTFLKRVAKECLADFHLRLHGSSMLMCPG